MKKMPLSLKITFFLTLITLVGELIMVLGINNYLVDAVFFGQQLNGISSIIYNLFYVATNLLTLWVILKKISWGWKLILFYNLATLIAMVGNFSTNSHTLSIQALIILDSITIVLTLILSYFIYKNRAYFAK